MRTNLRALSAFILYPDANVRGTLNDANDLLCQTPQRTTLPRRCARVPDLGTYTSISFSSIAICPLPSPRPARGRSRLLWRPRGPAPRLPASPAPRAHMHGRGFGVHCRRARAGVRPICSATGRRAGSGHVTGRGRSTVRHRRWPRAPAGSGGHNLEEGAMV